MAPRRLCRHQGGGRGHDRHSRQGAARQEHHRQRYRARADGDQALPRRQAAGGDRAPLQAGAAGTSRPAAGYRRRGGLPRRPGRRLDQRPDAARQWRDHLTRIPFKLQHADNGDSIMSKKIILITGASSGFGRLTAEALAKAGNTVYASMRDIGGRNAKNAAEMAETSKRDGADLRAIELDVPSRRSMWRSRRSWPRAA